jgi:predicted acetyltransferase
MPRHPAILIRPMRATQVDALAETGLRTFRSGDREAWQRLLGASAILAPDDTLVATIGGRIAGHLTGFRFMMSLCGRDVPVRGIAGVAVVPEFRRQGVADAMMVALHKQMCRRREALSMLYPFRMSFYRKFGYGTVEWVDHLRVTPSRLPASPLRKNVRHLERPADEALLHRVYEASRHLGSGAFVRHPAWWERRVWTRVNDGVVYEDPKTRRAQGYALYDVPAEPAYPRQQAHVREIVAHTPDAFRGLLGYFEAMADQFKFVELSLPRGLGVGLLSDFEVVGQPESLRLLQTAGLTGAGAMLRLVDVAAAFALHPAPAASGVRGRVGIDLTDPVIAAQRGAFDVTFGARGARVVRGRAASRRVALSAAQLAQVYGGGASARALLAQGMATGSEAAASTLDDAFAGTRVFLGLLNGF